MRSQIAAEASARDQRRLELSNLARDLPPVLLPQVAVPPPRPIATPQRVTNTNSDVSRPMSTPSVNIYAEVVTTIDFNQLEEYKKRMKDVPLPRFNSKAENVHELAYHLISFYQLISLHQLTVPRCSTPVHTSGGVALSTSMVRS